MFFNIYSIRRISEQTFPFFSFIVLTRNIIPKKSCMARKKCVISKKSDAHSKSCPVILVLCAVHCYLCLLIVVYISGTTLLHFQSKKITVCTFFASVISHHSQPLLQFSSHGQCMCDASVPSDSRYSTQIRENFTQLSRYKTQLSRYNTELSRYRTRNSGNITQSSVD